METKGLHHTCTWYVVPGPLQYKQLKLYLGRSELSHPYVNLQYYKNHIVVYVIWNECRYNMDGNWEPVEIG